MKGKKIQKFFNVYDMSYWKILYLYYQYFIYI